MRKNDDLSLVGLGCLLLLLITPISIATVVNFIVPKPAKPKSEKEQTTGEIIAQVLPEVFLNPLFAVLFGWIIYQFV